MNFIIKFREIKDMNSGLGNCVIKNLWNKNSMKSRFVGLCSFKILKICKSKKISN